MRLILAIILILLLSVQIGMGGEGDLSDAGSAARDATERFDREMDVAQQQYDQRVHTARLGYLAALRRAQDEETRMAHLEAALAIKKKIVEIEAQMEKTGSPPNALDEILRAAKFLDYRDDSWHHDIHESFHFEKIDDRHVRISVDERGGYEHKLILFNSPVLHANITIERGTILVGFRPTDLAPSGYEVAERLGAGTYQIDMRLTGHKAEIMINGESKVLTGTQIESGFASLGPSKSCTFIVNALRVE